MSELANDLHTLNEKKIQNDTGAARSQRNAGMHGRVATISVISLVGLQSHSIFRTYLSVGLSEGDGFK